MSRSDPVRALYHNTVEFAERVGDGLFVLTVLLSFAVLLVDKSSPSLYQGLNIIFTACVAISFVSGLALRLYFSPRAEQARRADFLSNAFDVDITVNRTDGYYNNAVIDPIRRMAAQLFENALFTMSIAGRMALRERAKVTLYFTAWLVLLLWREVEIGILVVVSQVVFSEQLLSKLLRLEWLRVQSERVHAKLHQLFQSKASKANFTAIAMDALLTYETAKANASITMSSKLFDEMNPALTAQWTCIQTALKIP